MQMTIEALVERRLENRKERRSAAKMASLYCRDLGFLKEHEMLERYIAGIPVDRTAAASRASAMKGSHSKTTRLMGRVLQTCCAPVGEP